MVYGKTYIERRKEKQKYFENIRVNGIKKFAWKPVQLNDGKKVWLEKYFIFYNFGRNHLNELYMWSGTGIKFLTQKEAHDALYIRP